MAKYGTYTKENGQKNTAIIHKIEATPTDTVIQFTPNGGNDQRVSWSGKANPNPYEKAEVMSQTGEGDGNYVPSQYPEYWIPNAKDILHSAEYRNSVFENTPYTYSKWLQNDGTITDVENGQGLHTDEFDVYPMGYKKVVDPKTNQEVMVNIPDTVRGPKIFRPAVHAARKLINFADGGNLNYLNYLKKGGIHIKPENKGKFTSYCGGKVTEECIQKGKHSPSATIRKRATFAANARKWAGGAIATRLSPFKQDPSKIYEQYLSFDPYENDLSLYNPNPQDSTEGEQEKVKVEQEKVEVPEKTTATKLGSWKEFRDTLIAALQKKGFTGEAAQTLVAQMGLETGHGKHMSGNYNYGNITAGKNWSGKTVQKVDNHNGKTYSFRSYDDLDQAMNDYVNLLTRSYGVTPQDTKDQIYAKLTGGNQRGRKWAEAQNYTQNIDSVYNMYWK